MLTRVNKLGIWRICVSLTDSSNTKYNEVYLVVG